MYKAIIRKVRAQHCRIGWGASSGGLSHSSGPNSVVRNRVTGVLCWGEDIGETGNCEW